MNNVIHTIQFYKRAMELKLCSCTDVLYTSFTIQLHAHINFTHSTFSPQGSQIMTTCMCYQKHKWHRRIKHIHARNHTLETRHIFFKWSVLASASNCHVYTYLTSLSFRPSQFNHEFATNFLPARYVLMLALYRFVCIRHTQVVLFGARTSIRRTQRVTILASEEFRRLTNGLLLTTKRTNTQ